MHTIDSPSPKHNTKSKLSFKIAGAEDFFQIKHFLKSHKTHSANRGDWIFCVYRENQGNHQLTGLARLLPIKDQSSALWLRGLFIAPDYRHQKIASSLLNYAKNQLQSAPCFQAITDIFAFSEKHLEHFYLNNGYQLIEHDSDSLPTELQITFQNSVIRGNDWLCWQLKIKNH